MPLPVQLLLTMRTTLLTATILIYVTRGRTCPPADAAQCARIDSIHDGIYRRDAEWNGYASFAEMQLCLRAEAAELETMSTY